MKGLDGFNIHGGASILEGIDTSGLHLTRRRAGFLKNTVVDTVEPLKNGRKRRKSEDDGARKSKKIKRSHTLEKKHTEGIDSDRLKDTNSNVVPETGHSRIVDSSLSSAPEQKE